jgi:flagellar biosynthetic protein FliR
MSFDINSLLTGWTFAFAIIFARLGTGFMIVPGFGDAVLPANVRLLLAVGLSFCLMPVLAPLVPQAPQSPAELAALVAGEALVGALIGTAVRLLFSALETAGTIMASQMGLANAFLFNPQMGSQSTLPTILLANVGILLFFITGLHRMFLFALRDSYSLFPPGGFPAPDGMQELIARYVAASFTMAIRLAAPFFITGLVFFLGLGLIARLMPQLQVFFVALPLQLLLGAAMLAITLSVVVLVWLSYADAGLSQFVISTVGGG